jgi:hypothetical protein
MKDGGLPSLEAMGFGKSPKQRASPKTAFAGIQTTYCVLIVRSALAKTNSASGRISRERCKHSGTLSPQRPG